MPHQCHNAVISRGCSLQGQRAASLATVPKVPQDGVHVKGEGRMWKHVVGGAVLGVLLALGSSAAMTASHLRMGQGNLAQAIAAIIKYDKSNRVTLAKGARETVDTLRQSTGAGG
jgi:hypothetical protein